MIFIKQVGERTIILNESLSLVQEFRDSYFIVENDRILVKKGSVLLASLPMQSVGILYN